MKSTFQGWKTEGVNLDVRRRENVVVVVDVVVGVVIVDAVEAVADVKLG